MFLYVSLDHLAPEADFLPAELNVLTFGSSHRTIYQLIVDSRRDLCSITGPLYEHQPLALASSGVANSPLIHDSPTLTLRIDNF
ncbi:uncharacterized protein CLUP02_00500 [Colletotrichum lupini]|uniref:Uncharacterized protein n=1 Tax=Colletotrichum lupini TaxID=145971 RepID=A0A9Q8W768_9PEZI|nr:uncharacterized protein CLUP02_00500 [Colletotrichum lupini]UQC73853.1 hypothetical protein CLUP02_00500 [Colletotrichum lupini]